VGGHLSELLCKQCNAIIPNENRAAGIAISVASDEYIYSYWRCDACFSYTIRSYYDPFMGNDAEVILLGAVPKETGEQILELIDKCPDRMDKWCDCESHRLLYYGTPRT
jgi:hypothetical protein